MGEGGGMVKPTKKGTAANWNAYIMFSFAKVTRGVLSIPLPPPPPPPRRLSG